MLESRPLKAFTGLTLILLSYFSLKIGHVEIDFFPAFFDGLSQNKTADTIILWELRLPRTLMCLIVGSGLGLAGAALQGYCLLYTSPSPRDVEESRMPSSA